MKVALFGASGMIGSRIHKELKERGHTVMPLSRKVAEGAVDATDADQVAKAVEGQDAVISAIGPKEGENPVVFVRAAKALLAGLKAAKVSRLLVVGGAGSLYVGPGMQLVDTSEFPPAWKPAALGHRESLQIFRHEKELDWTYISPAAQIEPGPRSGKYRLGGDDLLTNDQGRSIITAEDFAVAVADILEKHLGSRTRVTAAY